MLNCNYAAYSVGTLRYVESPRTHSAEPCVDNFGGGVTITVCKLRHSNQGVTRANSTEAKPRLAEPPKITQKWPFAPTVMFREFLG